MAHLIINPLPAVFPQKFFPKGLVIVIIVFLVGIISVLLYQKYQPARSDLAGPLSPTAKAVDPTAGWKIYTDEKNGFSFQYPINWQAREEVNSQHQRISLFNSENKRVVSISYESKNNSLNSGSYTISLIKSKQAQDENFLKLIANETINGKIFSKAIVIANPQYVTYFTEKNEIYYAIDFIQQISVNELTKTEEIILSTFKFTDNVPGEDILPIIQNLTKPMVWSVSKSGTIFNSFGQEITGQLIETNIPLDKVDDKLVSVITTNGWEEIPAESVGGKDGAIITYKKQIGSSTQKLIVRFGTMSGVRKYSILLNIVN